MSFVNRSRVQRILAGTAQRLKWRSVPLGPFIYRIVNGERDLTGLEEFRELMRQHNPKWRGGVIMLPETEPDDVSSVDGSAQ